VQHFLNILKRLSCLFLLYISFQSNILYSQTIDSNAVYTIRKISMEGNRITRERIILRELVKKENDTLQLKYLPKLILRSEQNIFNTQLFIYDSIFPIIRHVEKEIDVRIVLKERWYIWPVPLFEIQDRNFNTWWQTKDFFRVNYGFAIGFDNFTGNKDKMVLGFKRGYTEQYGAAYQLPYLNKAQTLGFKALYLFTRNNEVTYRTENNLPVFIRDYKNYVFSNHEMKLGLNYREGLYLNHTLEFLYKTVSVHDSVTDLNPHYLGSNRTRIEYASIQYRYNFDNRDNKQYPLIGWAFDLWAEKDGLEFKENAPIDNLMATLSLKKHTHLGKRFYLANQIIGRLMQPEKLPFYFNRGLGYNEIIRGYEYYVMDGQNYGLLKNSLRFQLVKPRIFHPKILRRFKQFNAIPFYAFINLHGDLGYIEDRFYGKTNSLNNSWQYGYGIGLDMVSFYDLVLRTEYSFNKQGQGGVFFHLTSGF
jgi:outer membrane protein assembly factor BamA